MTRHVFISDCEQCGAEGVAGSHQPGHVFGCFECQGAPQRAEQETAELIAAEIAE